MSSFTTILDDAEKIIPDLVPQTATLGPVVGVLILQVEKLVGHELGSLSDDVLGIKPPAPAEPEPTAEQAELAALKERIAALEEIKPQDA